jgi:23S rRNA (uracil1939-C5)-methyltransferase
MTLSGKVEKLNQQGLGLIKSGIDSYYVPYVIEGEEVEFTKKFSCNKFNRGALSKIIKPSKGRTDAPCPHFTSCGGCNLQHLQQNFYQEFKKSLVEGIFDNIKFHFLTPGNRRRATFHLKKDANLVKIGFYEFESQNIVNIETCQLLSKKLFSYFLEAKEILLTNINLLKDKTIDFSITELDNGCEIVFIFKNSYLKDFELLAAKFNNKNFARVSFKKESQIIMSKEFFPALISMNGFTFPYPRAAFLQATSQAEKILSNLATEFAVGKLKIVDLYSGIGPYSLAASEEPGVKIESYEGSNDMVESLQNLARRDNLTIEAFCRDLHNFPVKNWREVDGVIINPPRNGAERQIIEIAKNKVPEVLMISCSLNELKRDLSILLKAGYKIAEMNVIDQFPWSNHLEPCTKLTL